MKIKLDGMTTGASSVVKELKDQYKEETKIILKRIAELQDIFHADGKRSLLIVLQGMDASGKDGLIKKVFGVMNPIGCRPISFKKPTAEEMSHDFLWRIHKEVPALGMVHIFNRSHYEDVLIQKVHHWVDDDVIKRRYDHINNFERMLTDSGTVVLKFFLNISRKEQMKRLEERMTDPNKSWKYNKNDMIERVLWDDYMDAYEKAINNCCDVPWNIIPSDQNWLKEHIVASTVCRALERLELEYPKIKSE